MYSKKNLVFSCITDKYNYLNNWISPFISYDIFINYLGDKDNNDIEWINKISGYSNIINYKTNAINELYKNKIIDLSKYEYIALIDEDLKLDRYDLTVCFELMLKYDLYFGSPSIEKKENNIVLNNIFYENKDCKIRYTNILDNRAIFIKSDILINFLDNYNNELDNYGIEYLFIEKYKNNQDKIAIFDLINCQESLSLYYENDKLDSIEKQKDKFNLFNLEKKIEINEPVIYDYVYKKKIQDNFIESLPQSFPNESHVLIFESKNEQIMENSANLNKNKPQIIKLNNTMQIQKKQTTSLITKYNNKKQSTNNKKQSTNNKKQSANNKKQSANNKKQSTNNKKQSKKQTNNKYLNKNTKKSTIKKSHSIKKNSIKRGKIIKSNKSNTLIKTKFL